MVARDDLEYFLCTDSAKNFQFSASSIWTAPTRVQLGAYTF
jgi:hypothetical protein